MKQYEIHPLAACWPKPANYEEIKASIKADGLLEPITLFEDKVLEGAQRYQICRELSIEGRFQTPEIKDPFAYVIAHNKHRRHATKAQIAIAVAAMANLEHGSNRFLRRGAESAPLLSREELAEQIGVSATTIAEARNILKNGAPEVIESVRNGELNTDYARDIARLPKAEQPVALTKVKERKKGVKASTEDKNWETEYLDKINTPIPFPEGVTLPIHPDGEDATRRIQDAIVFLRRYEPEIVRMHFSQLEEDIFTYSKRIHFFHADHYPIDQCLVDWNTKVNRKAVARENLLKGRRRRKEWAQVERTNRKIEAREKKGRTIHGFEGGWRKFKPAFKRLLGDFHLDDAELLKAHILELLQEYFGSRHEARQRALNGKNKTKLPAKE